MQGDELIGRTLGDFELVERLGSGGFATVYRARQRSLSRDVAVKVLDPLVARDPDAARRFEQEGRSAAALDHPNIVGVFTAGRHDGLVYIAMRLVPGVSLEQRLADDGPMSAAEVSRTLSPIARALGHAHAAGLVHRDVKPGNILLHGDRVWLTDFGIAVAARDAGRYTQGAIGTVEFMAPEQAAMEADIGPAADFYSLGCTAHACLTGAAPFPGTDPVRTLMAHASEPVPPTGDDAWDAFFARVLEKDPARRPDTPEAFLTALAEVVTPEDALPDPVIERLGPGVARGTILSGPPDPPDADADDTALAGRDTGRGRRVAVLASLGLLMMALVSVMTFQDESGDGEVIGARPSETNAGIDLDGTVFDVDGVDPGDGGATADEGEAGDDTSTAAGARPGTTQPTAGATAAEEDAPRLQQGGIVRVALDDSVPLSPNPHISRLMAPAITGNVLPPLFVPDENQLPQPWLAAGPVEIVSEDPLVARWTLRPDAVWDDGTTITSSDVAATFDYITADDTNARSTLLYDDITEFRVLDEQTFEVVIEPPHSAFGLMFSTIHPVIKAAAWEAHLAGGGSPADFLEERPMFSGGPFLVQEFIDGERITLVPNERWWGPSRPNLGRVELVGGASSNADQLLTSGGADIIIASEPALSDLRAVRAVEGVTSVLRPAGAYFHLALGMQGATADPAVRLAIAEVIDRDALAATVSLDGTRPPLHSLAYAADDARNVDPFATFDGDDAEAEQHMLDGGYVRDDEGLWSLDGERLNLLVYVRNNLNAAPHNSVTISALTDFGFDVTLRDVDFDGLQAAYRERQYQVIVGFNISPIDPVEFIGRFSGARCGMLPECPELVGPRFNNTGYDNPAVTALLEQAAVTYVEAERTALIQQAEQRMVEDGPVWVPLTEIESLVAWRDDLGGIAPTGLRAGVLGDLVAWGYLADD